MYSYPLRAESVDGTMLVPFTLLDGPCKMDEKHFVLTARKDSPILKYGTILRGSDVEDVFEGDYIEVDGKEYLVIYRRGLIALDSEGTSLDFLSAGKFKVVSNIYKRGERNKIRRKKHKYRYDDISFQLDQVYGIHNGKLLLNFSGGVMMDVEIVQQSAGLKKGSVEMYFGDEGLHLFRGKCVTEDSGKLMDIAKGEFINEECIRHWRK